MEENNSKKKCTKCHQQKNVTEFRKNEKNKSGITSKCKQCYTEYETEYREKNRDSVRAYHQKWAALFRRAPKVKKQYHDDKGRFKWKNVIAENGKTNIEKDLDNLTADEMRIMLKNILEELEAKYHLPDGHDERDFRLEAIGNEFLSDQNQTLDYIN